MAGKEFEKQMWEKINKLRVQPSPAVWDNVEALIKKDKRKRWGIIFFLIAIVLSGTVLIITSPFKNPDNSSDLTDNSASNPIAKTTDPERNHSVAEQIINPPDSQIASSISATKHTSSVKRFNKKAGTLIKISSPDFNSDPTLSEVNKESELVIKDREVVTKQIPESIGATKVIAITQTNKLSDTSRSSAVVKKQKIGKPKKWIPGLMFTGGISSISQNFSLTSRDVSAFSLTGGAPSITPNTNISSSLGINAGISIRRVIDSSVSIGSGLNYQMFSTTINDQRNKFHFLQLPAEVQIKITKGKLPLFLHAGISLSGLIGRNIVQDSITRSSNSSFNKIQSGLSTGVLIKPFKNHSIIIGPYLYYGASSLAKTGFYKDQHFTFIGLQTKYEFRKK